MTKTEARWWVESHNDHDPLDRDELEAAFTALTGCSSENQTVKDMWSEVCAICSD